MELKAKELRQGNLFIDKYSKQIIPVLEILRSGNIVFDFECMGVWQAEPIPLTEEWLLKFGFEHREFSFDKGSFFLSKRRFKNEYLYQAHTHRFQVKYVHQLQNLYFALTSEELNIKV